MCTCWCHWSSPPPFLVVATIPPQQGSGVACRGAPEPLPSAAANPANPKPTRSKRMKAIYFEQHGELDVLRYGDLPAPVPGPGEVRVELKAAALNQLDIWVRRGWPGIKVTLPHVGGSDGAGVVAELGPGVSGVSVGDRVGIDPGISTRTDEWTRRGEDSLSPGYQI